MITMRCPFQQQQEHRERVKNMEESMKDIEDLLQQREAQLRDVLERI